MADQHQEGHDMGFPCIPYQQEALEMKLSVVDPHCREDSTGLWHKNYAGLSRSYIKEMSGTDKLMEATVA